MLRWRCLAIGAEELPFSNWEGHKVHRHPDRQPSTPSFPGDQAPHRCFDTQHLHSDTSVCHQHRGTQCTPQTPKQEPLKHFLKCLGKHVHSPVYYQQHSPCPSQLQLQQSLSTIRPQVNRISTGLLVPTSGDKTLCPQHARQAFYQWATLPAKTIELS